jgi:hypothetical protein
VHVSDPPAHGKPSASPSKGPDQTTDGAINASAADPLAPRAPPASPSHSHSRPTRDATPIDRDASAPLEAPQIKKDPYAIYYTRTLTPIVLDEDSPMFQDRGDLEYDDNQTPEEVENQALQGGLPTYYWSPGPERSRDADDPMTGLASGPKDTQDEQVCRHVLLFILGR